MRVENKHSKKNKALMLNFPQICDANHSYFFAWIIQLFLTMIEIFYFLTITLGCHRRDESKKTVRSWKIKFMLYDIFWLKITAVDELFSRGALCDGQG